MRSTDEIVMSVLRGELVEANELKTALLFLHEQGSRYAAATGCLHCFIEYKESLTRPLDKMVTAVAGTPKFQDWCRGHLKLLQRVKETVEQFLNEALGKENEVDAGATKDMLDSLFSESRRPESRN